MVAPRESGPLKFEVKVDMTVVETRVEWNYKNPGEMLAWTGVAGAGWES